MTELTLTIEVNLLLLFFSFLLTLAIGLAVYEWVNDNNVPDWIKEEDK